MTELVCPPPALRRALRRATPRRARPRRARRHRARERNLGAGKTRARARLRTRASFFLFPHRRWCRRRELKLRRPSQRTPSAPPAAAPGPVKCVFPTRRHDATRRTTFLRPARVSHRTRFARRGDTSPQPPPLSPALSPRSACLGKRAARRATARPLVEARRSVPYFLFPAVPPQHARPPAAPPLP